MEKYSLIIWFRYSICEEMEQDFEHCVVDAESKEDAESKAIALYKSKSVIPFKVEFIC